MVKMKVADEKFRIRQIGNERKEDRGENTLIVKNYQ